MKNILHIIPYHNLYPPQNGGQLRCFHLMNQLGKYHQLDVLIYQNRNEIINLGYSDSNVQFINTTDYLVNEGIFKFLPRRLKTAIRYRWLTKTLFESASLEVLEFAHVIKALSKQGKQYDVVICEHLSSLSLSSLIKRHFPKARLVNDAHNIDYKLINDTKTKEKTKFLESHIYKKADCFWACSENDVIELQTMNNNHIKGLVVPNGVDATARPFHEDKSSTLKNILFCGSLDYEPNSVGLHWFYNEVWPLVLKQIPDINLTIIGRGNLNNFDYLKNNNSINLIGAVDDVVPYYQNAFIAIVPLLVGSGTRLKVLEAMSMGNPIVSTTIGIEGINVENNKHALICDEPAKFASAIAKLIKLPEVGHDIRKNARILIDCKYDWNQIGTTINP